VLAHPSAEGIALGVALILIVVPAALIDLEHRIIPNRITALGAVLALIIGLALDPAGEPERLIAGVAAGGFLLLAALAYPGGMGMGDVKLAAVMGLFLGWAVAPAILIALLAGVLVGAVVMARKGAHAGRKTAVPFGPFLALGAVIAVYAGGPLVDLYINHFVH
jgi:leader peptidase (prepilin peptidase) / N-methyltransferase